MRNFRPSVVTTLAAWLTVVATVRVTANADPPFGELLDLTDEFQVEVAASGLNNPCGLVIRPGRPADEPYQVLLNESGAGRVLVASAKRLDEFTEEIRGFPTGDWDVGSGYQMGPMGAALLTATKLAVGYGGGARGPVGIRVYRLQADRLAEEPSATEPTAFDQFDHEVLPTNLGATPSPSDGQFFSLVKNDAALYVAGGGSADGDWILKASVSANKLADLQPFIDGAEKAGASRVTALHIDSRSGKPYLLAGQSGEAGDQRDSRLAFYAPVSGRLAVVFTTGLYDIVALAYCPSSGNLYAADAAWHDPDAGGIYRLDATVIEDQQACQAVRVARCVHPTSLQFAPDGATLLVTAFGPAGEQRDGRLLQISGEF